MIDAHVHLDKGVWSLNWVQKFVDKAIEQGINELYLLVHTNMFIEYMPIYEEMAKYNEYQKNWVENKKSIAIPLSHYIDFIIKMKKVKFPIKIKYGLEVCYSPEYNDILCEINRKFHIDLDFSVGSIHTIEGWAFSHLKQKWSENDVNTEEIYKKYYKLILQLIQSKLFDGLAHPTSLACFGTISKLNNNQVFQDIALSLNDNKMYVELSSGLALNYKTKDFGIDFTMLEIMKDNNVKILTASDAHKPEDVGAYIKEIGKYL